MFDARVTDSSGTARGGPDLYVVDADGLNLPVGLSLNHMLTVGKASIWSRTHVPEAHAEQAADDGVAWGDGMTESKLPRSTASS